MTTLCEQDSVSNTTCELNITKSVSKRFRERYGGIEELKVPSEVGDERKDRMIRYMLIGREALELSELRNNCAWGIFKEASRHIRNKPKRNSATSESNTKRGDWGFQTTDRRGQLAIKLIAFRNMIVANNGDKQTFQRGDSTSYIDITFSTNGMEILFPCQNAGERTRLGQVQKRILISL